MNGNFCYEPQFDYEHAEHAWFGEVPDHWSVRRLKSVTENVLDQTGPQGSGEVYIALENVESWTGKVTLPEPGVIFDSQVKRFRAGDVLLGKLRPYLAKVARLQTDGVCVGEFLVMRPFNGALLSDYLEQSIRCKPFIDAITASTYGAKMPRANWDFIGGMPFPIPPLAEQRAIVRYLDEADERIQRAISAKKRLIELLTEQRQAIIHQAVTRGLDPNVRLKDSGVEWLGEVPEHWEVVQLGRIGSFSKCSGGTKADEIAEGIPCVRYGDLYTSHKTFIESTRSFISEEKAQEYTPIHYGDILFAGSGETIEEIGTSAVNLLDSQARGGGDIILFRPQMQIDARFSGYLLDSSQSQYQKSCMGRGITVMHVYGSELKYLWLSVPSLDEQRAIVYHLDKMIRGIDITIENAQRQIDLLRQYRTRLIADVVTGQVDVRGAVENEVALPVA